MPHPAEYAERRLNALTFPGPAFNERRTRSEINAGRHGITARIVVLTTEDLAAYKQFAREIVDSLDAQTPLERQFAHTIADNQWRINRFRSVEDGMLGLGHSESAGDFDADHPEIHAVMTAAKAFRDHSQAFVNLSICEQRLHRSLKDALRQLKELQAERRELSTQREKEIGFALQTTSIPDPPQAATPASPDQIGFVLQPEPAEDPAPNRAGEAAALDIPRQRRAPTKIGFVLQTRHVPPTINPKWASDENTNAAPGSH